MTALLRLTPMDRLAVALGGLALVLAETACDPGSTPAAPSSHGATAATSAGVVESDDAQASPEAANGDFIVLPASGRYAIGRRRR